VEAAGIWALPSWDHRPSEGIGERIAAIEGGDSRGRACSLVGSGTHCKGSSECRTGFKVDYKQEKAVEEEMAVEMRPRFRPCAGEGV
jgi:hypothetical protein